MFSLLLLFCGIKMLILKINAQRCSETSGKGSCSDSILHCLNGGTLVASKNYCSCPPGFKGKTCQISACGKHGKVVSRIFGGFSCSCSTGWKGQFCDYPVCEEGTAELNSDGYYQCVCEEFYQGDLCDTKRCLHGKLQHKSILIYFTSQECECDRLWTGDFCHLPVCVNGKRHGKVCRCDTNYAQPHCERCLQEFQGYKCLTRASTPQEQSGISSKTQLVVAIVVPITFCGTVVLGGLAYRWYLRRRRGGTSSRSSSNSEVGSIHQNQRNTTETENTAQSNALLPSPPPAYSTVMNEQPPTYQEAISVC